MSVSDVSVRLRYFCYVCGREVEVDSTLHCRQCASEFVEEIETLQQQPQLQPVAPVPVATSASSVMHAPPRIADQIGAMHVGSFMNAFAPQNQSVRIAAPVATAVLPWHYATFQPPRPSGDYVGSNAEMNFVLNQLFHTFGPRNGNGSPPTPPNVIAALTVHNATADVLDALTGDKVCVICQNELTRSAADDALTATAADADTDGEIIILPICHHYFHRACLVPWLYQHSQCPTCRRAID